MTELFTNALLLPAVILAALAFVVPRLLARKLPEGVKPLFLNAFLSTCLLFLIASFLFVGLYLLQGLDVAQLMDAGLANNVALFGRLGLTSAIIWAPIMLLSIAGLPRNWVNETW